LTITSPRKESGEFLTVVKVSVSERAMLLLDITTATNNSPKSMAGQCLKERHDDPFRFTIIVAFLIME
jgi:hypothetical protein